MTIAEKPVEQDSDERAADLVLARVHLRLGSLGLARVELETMAGRNGLDDDGIRDLAEVRWRTGDLAGAGDAAAAYLAIQPDDVISLVISAEIQASLGRPGEARRLAGQALAASAGPIDALFAGMPRSSVWPVDTGDPVEPDGTLFADLESPHASWAVAPAELTGAPADEVQAASNDRVAVSREAEGPGLWEAEESTIAKALPAPAELMSRARRALEAGRPGQAAAGMALALRADPGLAPAVLDLIAGRSEPVLALVRGDANSIVGHGAEAMRDYAAAVAAIGAERRSDERPLSHLPERSETVDRRADAAADAAADASRGKDQPVDPKEDS
jgi:hypothetical protein